MIKELIEDLTFNRINLAQALTRAKIIAYKIKNEQFKEWLQSEINGYANKELPQYRNIDCDVFAEIVEPFSGKRTIPIDVSSLENEVDNQYSFYKMRMTQSIGTLEIGLEKDREKGNGYGYMYLPLELTRTISQMCDDGENITAIKRRVQLSQIDFIIEQTKQKLLDTLLELNDAFPDFENSFSNSNNVNEQKVQTIINHNIYGNNSNSNIGIGDNITQNINNENSLEELVKELQKIGVEKIEIEKIETIIKTEPKESLSKKALGWVGNVASKAIEKGVELQVPILIETISKYI
ncbi:hypothetical protein [Flavobacterium sp. YO64]|uniref:AbiTii domain-containing protein n=1 Tax=Flavobacterium sp. YO64 TaxID=394559 RepID=UPI00100C35AC|nr:hypothetical protein [Flavobacterium sp. YO64]RXM42669.1 hypothetical protein BOW57_15915 [Flavobacterium sp. YO64]